jgi:hypothetical protein
MNKLSNVILNKFRLVDCLVALAFLLFVFQIMPAILKFFEIISSNEHSIFESIPFIFLSFVSAIYQPAIIIGLAKIIQLIEEKKNDVRN